MIRDGGDPEEIERIPNDPRIERFGKHVFPAFEAALRGEKPFWPNLEDGYQVQRFTDAAMESVRSGRAVEFK